MTRRSFLSNADLRAALAAPTVTHPVPLLGEGQHFIEGTDGHGFDVFWHVDGWYFQPFIFNIDEDWKGERNAAPYQTAHAAYLAGRDACSPATSGESSNV